LVVKKMDFPRDTDADACAGFGNRQGAGSQIRPVADLTGDLQDALPCRLFDSVAPMQGAVHRADGNIRHFCDQMNSASWFCHLLAPVLLSWLVAVPFSILARASGSTTLAVRAS